VKNKKALLLLSGLCILVLLLSQCVQQVESHDPRGAAFAGSAQCRQCHQQIYDLHVQSTHFNSTKPASKENILGNFHAGKNQLTFNDSTYVQMQERDSGFYQVAFVNGIPASMCMATSTNCFRKANVSGNRKPWTAQAAITRTPTLPKT
jgi:hypothetical protein